jgi:hypothetical protein
MNNLAGRTWQILSTTCRVLSGRLNISRSIGGAKQEEATSSSLLPMVLTISGQLFIVQNIESVKVFFLRQHDKHTKTH